MKKTISALLISTVALASLTAGGGPESETGGGPAELEFWTMQLSPTFDDYIEGVIRDFQSTHPQVSINWIDVPWGDMETRILTAASAGDMPDIANMNPPFAQKLAQLGALLDMDEYASDVKERYFQGSWRANSFEGKTFGLPWYLTTPVLFYNKDLFIQAGLDPESPPRTYEEVFTYAETIRKATGKYGYMPVLSNHAAMEELEKAGVSLFSDDFNEADFARKAVVDFVNRYKTMMENDIIPGESLNEGTGTAIQMFSAGEVAMFNGGTSHAGMIQSNSQDTYGVTGVGPQPVGPGGKTNVAVMNIAVSASTPHPEPALEFAKFITNAENQIAFSEEAGAIVPSVAGAQTSDFFSVGDGTAVAEARIISAAQVENAQVIFPPIANFSDVRDAFLNALQRSLLEDGDIQKIFSAAEEEANQALER